MFKWLGGLVDSNEKQVKQLYRVVDQINELEPEFKKFSSNELRAKTNEFRARIAEATVGIKQRLVETQQKLEEALAEEAYERAARIRDEIAKRKDF